MVSAKILAPFVFSSVLFLTPLCGQDSPIARNAFARASVGENSPPQPASLTPEQRGDVYMARKMFRDAVDAYSEGPADSPMRWNKIGIAYHQLGDLNAAKRNYERAIKVDHKFADAINNVG